MEGPYYFPSLELKYESFKLLQWLYKYKNKRCKMYIGTKSLKFTPTKVNKITQFLKVNHWIIILKFGSDRILIENSALYTTKTLDPTSIEAINNNEKGYFLRNTQEGSEIIVCNHLIRFVNPDKASNYNISDIEKCQIVNLDPDDLINCCLRYLKENYTFYNRNCQHFARYINYNIRNNQLSFFSKMRLNFDGFTYVCLLIILIVVLIILYKSGK